MGLFDLVILGNLAVFIDVGILVFNICVGLGGDLGEMGYIVVMQCCSSFGVQFFDLSQVVSVFVYWCCSGYCCFWFIWCRIFFDCFNFGCGSGCCNWFDLRCYIFFMCFGFFKLMCKIFVFCVQVGCFGKCLVCFGIVSVFVLDLLIEEQFQVECY